jgi:hypothetical protein
MIQLKAFGVRPYKIAYLAAPESRRQAFYTIWIETCDVGFRVCKESGGLGKVWQRRAWEFESLQDAEKLFQKRVKEKINPERKYRMVFALN